MATCCAELCRAPPHAWPQLRETSQKGFGTSVALPLVMRSIVLTWLALTWLVLLVASCQGEARDSGAFGGMGSGSSEAPGSRTPPPTTCVGAEPILQRTGEPSGFVRCDDGFKHRVEAVVCAEPVVPGGCEPDAPGNAGECRVDADCNAAAYGSCFKPLITGCECRYGCASDDDCAPGNICACAGVLNASQCVPSGCTDSTECGDGLCGFDSWADGCDEREARMGCLSATSECRLDGDCQAVNGDECGNDPFGSHDVCLVSDGDWRCGRRTCPACG